ncbi:MAG TPA: response regulator transcription factor [Cyclobacteriaceae bacterium]|nr:response regulator transcription factor [Cyclobacteriaceae bacterium]
MKNDGIRILLADGQELTAAGLRHFLSDAKGIDIVDSATDADELNRLMAGLKPTLLIADYNLTDYLSISDIREAGRLSRETHILIISSDNNKSSILDVLQLGVKGYLTKECSKDEVLQAIHATAKGQKFFCHKILDIIMEKTFSPEPEACRPTVLTARETEILGYIAGGYSTLKIADKLHLSPHTIHTHRKSIIRKLNIKSPTEFVIYAIDLGILKTP